MYIILLSIMIVSANVCFSEMWSDSNKNHIVAGTPSVNSSSYIEMTQKEKDALTEVFAESETRTYIEKIKEAKERNKKSYWIEKAFKHQQNYDTYMNLHKQYGFDVSISTKIEATKIVEYKARYDAIP